MHPPEIINKLASTFRRLGVIEGFAFFAWLVQTFLEKKLIQFQDKYHLYSYKVWIRNNEESVIDLTQPPLTSRPIASFLIFIKTINENTAQDILLTMDSIRSQNITDWECLLLLSKSNHDSLFSKLSHHASEKIILLETNESLEINSAILTALPAMNGSWIIWTHPGDIHSENLLGQLIPLESNVAYWDEDLHVDQRRCEPFLKPDWSPELWISVDLLYCGAFKRDFLFSIANLNQKQQIISDCVFIAQKIEHIHAVLTHCKSTAWKDQENLQTHQSNVLAYLNLLEVHNPVINLKPNGSLKVSWQPTPEKISIIIPTKDNYAILSRCLNSIFQKTSYANYEIILVDDQSTDPQVLEYYQTLSKINQPVRIIQGRKPFNFSFACNQGAKIAKGQYLLFLNNDTEVLNHDWLIKMAQFASLEEVGIVGGKLLYPDHTIQHAGIVLGLEGHASHVFMGASETTRTPFGLIDWYRNYSAVTGACMMIRREVFEKLGGFDENYLLVFSDIEICLRAIFYGYRIVLNPDVCLIHYEGKSRGKNIPKEDILLGYRHFINYCTQGDPYFNPGLSHAWRMPSLRRSWEQNPAKRLQKICRYFYSRMLE